MGRTYRHQVVIDAPVGDVWAIVSDPRTHPEWWPEVVDVQLDGPLVEGGEFTRTSKPLPSWSTRRRVWVAGVGLGGLEGGALSLRARRHVGSLLAYARTGADVRRGRVGNGPEDVPLEPLNNAFFLKQWIVKVLDALPQEGRSLAGSFPPND